MSPVAQVIDIGSPRPPRGDGGATRLLTADELGERWQVPKAQVYRLTREGALPAVRIGRYYRYQLAAIELWETGGGAPPND